MKIYGLTGGIASGKSLAATFFKEQGIPVVDADQVSKTLSSPGGRAAPAIQKRFGTLDRAELRKIIFSDPQAKKDLEDILHPLIKEESEKLFKKLDPTAPFGIYEASLLIEAGRHNDFSGLILVESPEKMRIQRLMARDSISEIQAQQILKNQMPDQEKRKFVQFVLKNQTTPDALKKEILELIPRLK